MFSDRMLYCVDLAVMDLVVSSVGQFSKIRLAQFSASFLESWHVINNSSLIITVPGKYSHQLFSE